MPGAANAAFGEHRHIVDRVFGARALPSGFCAAITSAPVRSRAVARRRAHDIAFGR
jgi:hypothetical protein